MASEALIAVLEQKKSALAARCIDAMYRDPFWQTRFGDRGRRHAEEDSAYHVKYVIAALREGELNVFANYTLWLRGVLCARGMCSHHLAESFRQLVRALEQEGITAAEPAADVLQHGEECLRYRAGPAAEVERHKQTLEGHVRAELAQEPYRLAELTSFLADALARGDGQAWHQHLLFLREKMAPQEPDATLLQATLDALARGVRRTLSADALPLAQTVMRPA